LIATIFPAILSIEVFYIFALVEGPTLERTVFPNNTVNADVALGVIMGFSMFISTLVFIPLVQKAANFWKVLIGLVVLTSAVEN
jgi:hypothetical protein